MKNKPGFVFDTNVMVSALMFPNSVPARAVARARQVGEILLSMAVLHELEEVLSRKKFDRYVTEQERQEFLTTLIESSQPVEVSEALRVCRDPKDDKFLELANAGGAKFLITGDADLLTLSKFRETLILTAADFLERVKD